MKEDVDIQSVYEMIPFIPVPKETFEAMCFQIAFKEEEIKRLKNQLINKQPTVELLKEQKLKKGKWIDIDSQLYTWKVRCDQCGNERSMMSTQGEYPNFCENCGADMRKDVDQE